MPASKRKPAMKRRTSAASKLTTVKRSTAKRAGSKRAGMKRARK